MTVYEPSGSEVVTGIDQAPFITDVSPLVNFTAFCASMIVI